jgi:hypothetical protein
MPRKQPPRDPEAVEEAAYSTRLAHMRARYAEAIRYAAARGTSRKTLNARYGADVVDLVLASHANR